MLLGPLVMIFRKRMKFSLSISRIRSFVNVRLRLVPFLYLNRKIGREMRWDSTKPHVECVPLAINWQLIKAVTHKVKVVQNIVLVKICRCFAADRVSSVFGVAATCYVAIARDYGGNRWILWGGKGQSTNRGSFWREITSCVDSSGYSSRIDDMIESPAASVGTGTLRIGSSSPEELPLSDILHRFLTYNWLLGHGYLARC